MRHIVMAENPLGPTIAAHAFDHRGMVQCIGIDDQAGKQFWQGGKGRVIGDIGRGEQQRRFLAMQIGQFLFQPLVPNRRARDIPRTARTCTRSIKRLVHGGQNDRMLAHAKIVIAAPHGDRCLGSVGLAPDCMREMAAPPLDINESAVTPFLVQAVDRVVQQGRIVHRQSPFSSFSTVAERPLAPYLQFGMDIVCAIPMQQVTN